MKRNYRLGWFVMLFMAMFFCLVKCKAQNSGTVSSCLYKTDYEFTNCPSGFGHGCYTYSVNAKGFNVGRIYVDSIVSSSPLIYKKVPVVPSIWSFYMSNINTTSPIYSIDVTSIEENIGWRPIPANSYQYMHPCQFDFFELGLRTPSDTSKYRGIYIYVTK